MLNTSRKEAVTVACFLAFVCMLVASLTSPAKSQIDDLASVLSEDSWPMFQHDPQHSGYTNSIIPPTIRQKWNFTTFGAGAIRNPPVVTDGKVFFGSDDGNFYALNESTGSVMWFRSIGASTTSAAVDSSKRLVFVALGPILYALDELTGNVKWKAGAEFGINYPSNAEDENRPWYSSPVIDMDRGVLFIGGMRYWVEPPDPYYYWARQGATLYALNETSGKVVWRTTTNWVNNHLTPMPLVYPSPTWTNGTVFFAEDCMNSGYSTTGVPIIYPSMLTAIDKTTGSEIWSKEIAPYWVESHIRSSPSVQFGLVFIGSSDKKLYALNETTGEVVWQRITGDAIESSPAIDMEKELIFVGSNDGKLYSFSKVGTDIWQRSFDTAIKSSPILGDNKVLITAGKKLYALNESDGQEIWNFSVTGDLTSPVVSDGVIFVGSSDGRLYALFSAEKISTALSDPSTSVTYSHSALISTHLSDKNGTAIPNANVTFSLYYNGEWNSIGWRLTNVQGNASVSYMTNLPAGLYNLKVYYAGDFFYNSSYFIGKLAVSKESTSLAFPVSPIEVNYDDTAEISACLTDDENNPISGVNVRYQIFLEGSWINIGTNLTGTSGSSEITYTASITPGIYPVLSLFEGDSYYENCTTQATLIISKEVTLISDPSTVATYNDITTIQARLVDDEGLPVVGGNMTFWVYYSNTWNYLGSATTNTNGYAKINFFASLEPSSYNLKVTFDGNNFYLSREYIGILSIYSRLIVDNAFASRERADVGSVQYVFFHVIWQYNSSSVNGGVIYINATRLTLNATGWAELVVTSSKTALHTWVVTSINCNGATVFTQTSQNPSIIWDEIIINLSVESARVDVGKEISITIDATYAYDDQPFNGPITLNDTSFKLSSIGKKSYTVEQMNDPVRVLTTFKSNTLVVIWDKVEVVLQTTKPRIDVGESPSITINAFYAYDNQPFVGTIILNDTSFTSSAIGKKSYVATQIIDRLYNVSSFTSNTISIIWDKIQVTISTDHTRIDLGKNASLTITAFYAYDLQPFQGTVSLNDTSLIAFSPTRKAYTVNQVSDTLHGLTSFSSNIVSIIWDEVIVNLSTDKQRIDVGKNTTITIEAKYSYDDQQFSGQILLNDTTFSLSSIGKKSYTVANIVDNNYGLTQFSSNTISVIYDRVQAEYSISNPSLGTLEVTIKLHSEYDGTPIDNAEVLIGGVKTTNEGNGIYVCKISSWTPLFGSDLTINAGNFQSIKMQIGGLPFQNFLLELVIFPIALVSASGLLTYRWKKKKQALLTLLRDLDPKVLEIAKSYGGILTKSVIAYELKTPLETAEKSLERFVKLGEAQKITKANFDVYDFASARTHLSKVDNRIITALRDNFRGLPKHELLEATGLTLEPLEESLERLEKNDVLSFNKTTKEYRLKGVVLGKTRCPSCNELADASNGICLKCGATL